MSLDKNVSNIRGSEAEALARPGTEYGSTFGEPSNASTIGEKDVPPPSSANSENTAVPSVIAEGTAAGAPAPDASKAPAEPEASRTALETTVIMAALCISVFLAALDITIVTTALPTISDYFHSSAGYTWVGSAYLLANAAATPIWGKISDIWGRKPILLCAAVVFFVGSALAGGALNMSMLIAARAIQGIGGGGLIVLVNITISDLFSMRNRGKYFGMVGCVWAFASAIGPVLGGVFAEKVSWRWCFYINLPITGAAFIILVMFLKLDNPRTPIWAGLKAIDWLGCLLIIGGVLMLLLGLEFGGVTYPWGSAEVICLIVFGILVSGLFVINEWKLAKYPIMPLRLFKHRSNVAALLVCFCHGYVFISGSYYLPLLLQAVYGATPLLSGVYILPFAMSLSVSSAATGVYIKKTGKYIPPIMFGLVFLTFGFGLFIDLPATKNWPKIIIYQIIAGIGVGPNFQAPLIALQTLVAPRDIGTATATFGFIRNLSTSISVVIGGVIYQNQLKKHQGTLVKSLGSSLSNVLTGGSAGASVGIIAELPQPQRSIARQAFSSALRVMWIQYVAWAALGLFISFFIGRQVLAEEHTVTKTGLAEQEAQRKELKEEKKRKHQDASRSSRPSTEQMGTQEV